MDNEMIKRLGEVLQGVTENLPPELKEMMAKAVSGGSSEEEVMASMMKWVAENPDAARAVEETAYQALAPLREDSEPVRVPSLWEDRSEEGKLSRLSPVYEAALAERLQFDEDAPELRSGPMEEGVAPAVPVNTDARNPVAIGKMLEKASEEVAVEIKALRSEWAENAQKMLEDQKSDLIDPKCPDEEGLSSGTKTSSEIAELKNLLPMVNPDGYQPGGLALARDVDQPTGTELAKLTKEERQNAWWKFFSTSHGRRSVLRTLQNLIYLGLTNAGYTDVEIRDFDPLEDFEIHAFASWEMNLSGPKATQADFSIIDIAAGSLLTGLVSQLNSSTEFLPQLNLEVTAVNTVDIRKVGWAARLVE
jgi:hypothetical protein